MCSRQPRRFLPALLSQARKLAETNFGPAAYEGDIDERRDSLFRGLAAVRQKVGRAVVVIDALDELEGEGRTASFLPPALPEGVRVMLTCRHDIPLVQTLRARLAGHLDERTLEPFDLSDFHRLLEQRLGTEALTVFRNQVPLPTLFERAARSPLYLTRFLEDVADRWRQARSTGAAFRVNLDDVPVSLEAVFDRVHDRIREVRDGQPPTERGRERARLLYLLCQAREALTLEQWTELAAADGLCLLQGEVRDHVREMSQFLLDVGGRYKPWHQGLTDHLRRHVLGEPGVRQTEDVFCRWLAGARGGRYALRHRVSHLLAAGRAEEAFALLTDLPELEVRVADGLGFAVAGDMELAAKALPAGPKRRTLGLLTEAVRRDVHFIDRHREDYPQGLFQCLWNTCWWYDCPEAARHYLEGRSPGQDAGVGLHALLEQCRAERERRQPGFVWLRSLRPTPLHLGTAQRAVLRGQEDGATSVACSPDGSRIVSGSHDMTLSVWDAASGAQLLRLRGHEWVVTSVAVSPDNRRIVSGSDDGTIRLWDLATGTQLLCIRTGAHWVSGVAFAPDGRRFASASSGKDRTVKVWDAESGAELLCLRGQRGWVRGVGFSPDGRRIVTGAEDRTVRIWDADSGAELLRLRGHEHSVTSVAFSPDGRRVVTGGADETARMFDAESGAELCRFCGHAGVVSSVAFAPDGLRVATGSGDTTVRVWDADNGVELLCLEGHEDWVNGVAFAPDGRTVVSGSNDHTIRVWDGRSQGQVLHLRGHSGAVTSLKASSNDRVVSGSEDGTIRVWDARTSAGLFCLDGHADQVNSVAVSPDGGRVASGSDDCTVRVWDLDGGVELWVLEGHEGCVNAVVFSPDGRRIASAADDKMVRVWDAESGTELTCLAGHRGAVGMVWFSQHGDRLVSSSWDESYRVWDARSGQCLEVRDAEADVSDVSEEPQRHTWPTRVEPLETLVLDAACDAPVAWVPVSPQYWTETSRDPTWAAAAGNHLLFFSLEGKPGEG